MMGWKYKDFQKEKIQIFLKELEIVDFYHFVDYELSQIAQDGDFRGDKSVFWRRNNEIEQIWMEGLYHLGPRGRFINLLYHTFKENKYSIHLIAKKVRKESGSLTIEVENRDIYIKASLPHVELTDSLPYKPHQDLSNKLHQDRKIRLEDYLRKTEKLLGKSSLSNYENENDYKEKINKNVISLIKKDINNIKYKSRIKNDKKDLQRYLEAILKRLLIFLYPTNLNPKKQYSAFVVPSYRSQKSNKEITNGGVVLLFNNFNFAPSFKKRVETINEKTALWSNLETTASLVSISRTHARKAASSQLFARNFDHHLAAHIMPRASISDIKSRLEEFGVTETDNWDFIEAMKNKLDEYVVARHRFLVDPFQSLKNYRFYSHVILPFIENTLLIDNIAASEDIQYNESGNKNRLQIRVCINDEELKAAYEVKCIEDRGNGNSEREVKYPDDFPYYIRPVNKNSDVSYSYEEFYNPKEIINGNDIEVAIPDPHAIYSILENVIRNSAKHNNRKLNPENGKKKDLEITFNIINENTDPDYYTFEIYDNISSLINEVGNNGFDDFKKKEKIDIIDEQGELRDEDLGIADMKVCSLLLKGESQINEKTLKKDRPLKIKKHEENGNFKYVFKVLKPQKICYIGNEKFNEEKKNELKNFGIRLFKNQDEFLEKASRIRTFFQFGIIDKDIYQSLTDDQKENLLLKLPHRVIIQDKNGNEDKIDGYPSYNLDFSKESKEILTDCWEVWIKKFTNNNDAKLIVYLSDNTGDSDRWDEIADDFTSDLFSLKFTTKSISDNSEYAETNIFYDHHANGAQEYDGALVDDNSYISFDKNSRDFNAIAFPDNSAPWMLPFEMLEAGLLKILIIDERLTEYGAKEYENAVLTLTENDSKLGYGNTTFKCIDACWAANVYVATHINEKPLKTELFKEKKSSHWVDVTIGEDSFKIKTNYPSFESAEKKFEVSHVDVVIIHRTFLNKFGLTLNLLKKYVPLVFLESGGTNLSQHKNEKAKFIAHDELIRFFNKKSISKYGLSKTLLTLTEF